MRAVLRRFIAVWRALRLALHLAYGLTMAIAYPRLSDAAQRRILQRWSRELLDVLGVRLLLGEHDPLHVVRHGLVVTNHISWLDVFVLNAVLPLRFVAKSEVRRWPVIGWLCVRTQTLFIERGKARSAARMNVQMVELLQQGACLAVFPEGTTTDGAQVAHFHSSLLQPAVDAQVPLHPVTLRYQDSTGRRSDAAAYIDELCFAASLWQILSTPDLSVRVVGSAPLHGNDRRVLTRSAHLRIATSLHTLNGQPNCDAPPLFDYDELSLHCLLLSPPLERGTSAFTNS